MRKDNKGWTDDLIARLRRLWDEGHATIEIGRRLGMSKNAVVGKAHRLDFPSRPSPILRGGASRPAPKRLPAPMLAEIAPVKALSQPIETVVSQDRAAIPVNAPLARAPLTVEKHACCWPIGEPGRVGFRFCDAPACVGKPYCEEHGRLAYLRPRPEERTVRRAANGR